MNVHVIKTVPITFKMVVDSYRKVRKGGKAAGIDEESWEEFDKKLTRNLYVIWNRLASGSYHPSAVKEVEIPKPDGRTRKLGIPTLRDRIAQGVVKEYMERRIDQNFHEHSYGYRPLKSGIQAIEQVRKNCLKYSWVIDMDIEKFFDEIDQELLMKAVEAMITEKWVGMYVKRWLEAKIENVSGEQQERGGKGTPQGAVISPLLANLFLHYALDKWLEREYSGIEFVRYADDIIIHCRTKEEAEEILQAVRERLSNVKLRLNERKTQIVYCRDYKRKETHERVQFGFLGFSYQPRKRKSRYGKGESFTAYTAEISKENQQRIGEKIRELINWRNTTMEIEEIAQKLNPCLRGWINYFGQYSKRELRKTLLRLDYRLIKWIQAKHKITGKRKASAKLSEIRRSNPRKFYHWEAGYCS